MKKTFEEKLFIDQRPDKDDGWEILEQHVEKKKTFFGEDLVLITKARRETTPVKITFSGYAYVQKYRVRQINDLSDLHYKTEKSDRVIKISGVKTEDDD